MPALIAATNPTLTQSAIRCTKRDFDLQWRIGCAFLSFASLVVGAVPSTAADHSVQNALNFVPTVDLDTDPRMQRSKRASERAKLSMARTREAEERRGALRDNLEKRGSERRNEHFRLEMELQTAQMRAHNEAQLRLSQLAVEHNEKLSRASSSGSMSREARDEAQRRIDEDIKNQYAQLGEARAQQQAEFQLRHIKRMAEFAAIEEREQAQYRAELAALNESEQARLVQERVSERVIEEADLKSDNDKFLTHAALQKAEAAATKANALRLCGSLPIAAAAKKGAGVTRHPFGRVVDSTGEALSGVIVTGYFRPIFHYVPTNGDSPRDIALNCVTDSFEAVTDAKGEYAFDFDKVGSIRIDKKAAAGSLVFYLPGYTLNRTELPVEELAAAGVRVGDGSARTDVLKVVEQTVSALSNPHDRRASELESARQRTEPLQDTSCAWVRHPELLRTLSIETRRLYREIYRADELDATGFPKESSDAQSDITQARARTGTWLDFRMRTRSECGVDAKSFATADALEQTERRTFAMVDSNRFWKPPAPEGRLLSMPAVRGRIIDKATRKPVSGATLFGSYNTVSWEIGGRALRGQLAQTIDIETGADGSFELPAWTSGARKLTGAIGFPEWGSWPIVTLYAPGYKLATATLNLRSDSIRTPEKQVTKKIATDADVEEILELEPISSVTENAAVAGRFMLEPKLAMSCVPRVGSEKVVELCEKASAHRCIWERFPKLLKRQGRMKAILDDPATDRHSIKFATMNQLISAQKELGARWPCANVESLFQP
jgi:hypothetical protein